MIGAGIVIAVATPRIVIVGVIISGRKYFPDNIAEPIATCIAPAIAIAIVAVVVPWRNGGNPCFGIGISSHHVATAIVTAQIDRAGWWGWCKIIEPDGRCIKEQWGRVGPWMVYISPAALVAITVAVMIVTAVIVTIIVVEITPALVADAHPYFPVAGILFVVPNLLTSLLLFFFFVLYGAYR